MCVRLSACPSVTFVYSIKNGTDQHLTKPKICTQSDPHLQKTFGGLRGNAHGSYAMARWKAHCRLPISDN